MLKRLIYIFTLCCFVNTSFGCIPGAYHSDMSLLDMLIGQFQGDDDGDEAMTRDVCVHHFNIARTTETARKLPRLFNALIRIFRPVQHVYGNFLIRKPILPAYYNFLFRLSPF